MGLPGCGGAQCRHHGERSAPRMYASISRIGSSLDGKSCTFVSVAGDFAKSEETAWQATLDINLRAVLVGAHVATQIMRKQQSKARAKGASDTLLALPLSAMPVMGRRRCSCTPLRGSPQQLLRGNLSKGHAEHLQTALIVAQAQALKEGYAIVHVRCNTSVRCTAECRERTRAKGVCRDSCASATNSVGKGTGGQWGCRRNAC